jgi:hypothetical protein
VEKEWVVFQDNVNTIFLQVETAVLQLVIDAGTKEFVLPFLANKIIQLVLQNGHLKMELISEF